MKALIATLLFPVLLKTCDGTTSQRSNNVPPPISTTNTSSGTNPASPLDTPIDGGLTVLLLAGAGYGLRRYRKSKQNQKNTEA